MNHEFTGKTILFIAEENDLSPYETILVPGTARCAVPDDIRDTPFPYL